MIVNKYENGDTLIISLEGRLDTNTAPEVERILPDLNCVNQIIFDFEKLEYISSFGLRLILKCKKINDKTKVINCNKEVYEIFDMTGFTELMAVEKALRKISIDNCEQIGEGFFGKIYRIDNETIVKVYKVPDSIELIKREIELAKKAFVLGIPTAIPYDIVKVDSLYGAVFELLDAKQVVDLINSDEELDSFAKKSADILKEMHSKNVEPGELPSRKQDVIELLNECKEVFPKESFEKLLKLLDTIPEESTLLHCDFHVKNIMRQKDEFLIIDMDKLSVGHPIFEFGAMYATYYAYACIDKQNTDRFLGMPLDVTSKLFNKTFKYYYNDKTDEELEEMISKLSVISYLQVLNLRLKYLDEECITQKEEIEFCKNYLIDIANKLNTLKY